MRLNAIKFKPDKTLKESKLQTWKQMLQKTEEKPEVKNDPRRRD